MFRDMEDINKIFDQLFDVYPEMKEQMNQDEQWRQQREQLHISKGMSQNDAKMATWSEYWNLAKERDGVEFSIRKIENT